jgi:hypothetical protein
VVPDNMDALEWLRKHLEAEGSDLLREMVSTFAERLMAAEVEVLCNAGYGEVTPERTNSRNGYRSLQLDSRVGSVDLSIPKLLACSGPISMGEDADDSQPPRLDGAPVVVVHSKSHLDAHRPGARMCTS